MNTISKKRTVEAPYWIGDMVYLRCAKERTIGMITAVMISGESSVNYWVSWGNGTDTRHWAMELTTEYVEDFGGVPQ